MFRNQKGDSWSLETISHVITPPGRDSGFGASPSVYPEEEIWKTPSPPS
jgi:hypothetical protein